MHRSGQSSEMNMGDQDEEGNNHNVMRLEVRHTGSGMSEEEEKDLSSLEIFDYEENSGLTYGIMIASMIIKAHGGNFGAFSGGLDTGSAFYFELPLASIEEINTLPRDQNVHWV